MSASGSKCSVRLNLSPKSMLELCELSHESEASTLAYRVSPLVFSFYITYFRIHCVLKFYLREVTKNRFVFVVKIYFA